MIAGTRHDLCRVALPAAPLSHADQIDSPQRAVDDHERLSRGDRTTAEHGCAKQAGGNCRSVSSLAGSSVLGRFAGLGDRSGRAAPFCSCAEAGA